MPLTGASRDTWSLTVIAPSLHFTPRLPRQSAGFLSSSPTHVSVHSWPAWRALNGCAPGPLVVDIVVSGCPEYVRPCRILPMLKFKRKY